MPVPHTPIINNTIYGTPGRHPDTPKKMTVDPAPDAFLFTTNKSAEPSEIVMVSEENELQDPTPAPSLAPIAEEIQTPPADDWIDFG